MTSDTSVSFCFIQSCSRVRRSDSSPISSTRRRPSQARQPMPVGRPDCSRPPLARHACALRSADVRTISITLLTLLILLTGPSGNAQIYSIGVGSPVTGYKTTILRVDEHKWDAGSIGLVQFRARTAVGVPWIRQTTFHFGSQAFTVRIPMVTYLCCAMFFGVTLFAGIILGKKVL